MKQVLDFRPHPSSTAAPSKAPHSWAVTQEEQVGQNLRSHSCRERTGRRKGYASRLPELMLGRQVAATVPPKRATLGTSLPARRAEPTIHPKKFFKGSRCIFTAFGAFLTEELWCRELNYVGTISPPSPFTIPLWIRLTSPALSVTIY